VKHLLIGTAGHIDHGKTRLVGRLTGIMTDRLPEEKSRGISIDLGFAHWEADVPEPSDGADTSADPPTGRRLQFGIIDVPGHERFVRNMVAGATGVNIALLVVAADDSVMPQTREHLEIMQLLGIETGVVAITKTDLVESDFVELVKADIEELVEGTFLDGCPIIPVSSETGEGFDELRQTILTAATKITQLGKNELFRMPIDRVFSIPGHGTVVTGSVLSGDVHAGETIELLPEQREVRVRSVQNHGQQTAEGSVRQRTAVNLAGLKTEELSRGLELATAGYLKPTRRLLVKLRSLSSSPLILKDRLELNLHLGTTETPARIILKGKLLKPGDEAFAELRIKEPVVAVYGQRFILRRISPALTVAGGKILDPCVPAHKRLKVIDTAGKALDSDSAIERLSFLLSHQDAVVDSPIEAVARVGVSTNDYTSLVEKLKAEGALLSLGRADRRLLIHRDRLNSLKGSVLRTIDAEIARNQPRRSLPRNTLITACREITQPDLLDAVFAFLLKTGELISIGENLGSSNSAVKLTKNQRQARDKILEAITTAGLAPPTTKELIDVTGQSLDKIKPLLNLCVEDGLLVKVSDLLFFVPEALEQARVLCENLFQETSQATMSELREAWGISRKFAVPLCEHFDAAGLTVRKDDVRIPGPNLSVPVTV